MTSQVEIVWKNVILLVLLHAFFLHGFYICLTNQANWKTYLFAYTYGVLGGQGTTSGAHRLWSHRSYKAKLPLQIILLFLQTVTGQGDVYSWARDHRVHHKFSDTDADPYNATRGFFYSHIGWVMCRKHPEVIAKGKTVDMSDLEVDPLIIFQKKHYMVLGIIGCIVLPTLVPWYFWKEDLYISFCLCFMFRYVLALHFTWLVNSAAHTWGYKPYDTSITSTDNKKVALFTAGEGFHNYHHTFPWDYKTGELGNYVFNASTAVIDFMAYIGWAYDLRIAPREIIKKRIERTGVSLEGEKYHSNDSSIK